jgi:hypothetical protein
MASAETQNGRNKQEISADPTETRRKKIRKGKESENKGVVGSQRKGEEMIENGSKQNYS